MVTILNLATSRNTLADKGKLALEEGLGASKNWTNFGELAEVEQKQVHKLKKYNKLKRQCSSSLS